MDTDEALLRRWAQGDADAGNALVQRHVATVYRFFANKLPDRLDDLAQQTFAACVQRVARIDPHRSFRAYLLGIARHILLHDLRSRARGGRALELEAAAIGTHHTSPSQHLALAEERQLLLAALREIPLGYQIILELYYWEGLRTPEIAIIMETTEGTVRSRLTRGRTLLRESIERAPAPTSLRASTSNRLEQWAMSLRTSLGEDDEPRS